MKKRSFAARLRAAQDRAIVAEKKVRQMESLLYRIKGDYSDVQIVADFALGEAADSAIRTARCLGFVVTVCPGRNNSEKFTLRAHPAE